MTSWGPGMRDRAVYGLSLLARREEWRTSEQGSRIVSHVDAALADGSPLVRRHAAEAFAALHADVTAEERVANLQELFVREPHPEVRGVFFEVLRGEVRRSPDVVDNALASLAKATRHAKHSAATCLSEDNYPTGEWVQGHGIGAWAQLIRVLALVHQTPFSLATLRDWARTPSQFKELDHALPYIRYYLAPGNEPELQERTFEFIATTATSALKCWNDILEQLPDVREATEAQRSELKAAHRAIENIAVQLYYASGSFEGKRATRENQGSAEQIHTFTQLTRFAELAIPTLRTCCAPQDMSTIHKVVETLVYLTPLDEADRLEAVAEAVRANPGYAYDIMSGRVIVPYLTGLLAEHRSLVLYNEEGVTAFRSILSEFAAAGNEEALVLAFTFANVFR